MELRPVSLISLLPLLALQAHGQATLTWDQPNANNAWNTTDANWTGPATFATNDNVIFNSATGETVTVDAGGVTAGTISVGANNGSWIFSGGSITSSGALTKSGTGTLTLSSTNSLNSVAINGGLNSATTGAIAVGTAGALGTGSITLGNTGTMTALFFQSGFGSNTLANNITFASGAVQTNLLATAGISQIVTLDGVLSGGNSSATIFLNNNVGGGVAKFRVTNSSNSVLGTWRLNRGALEFTSDAALGNSANDITLDVTGTNAGTGLTFGANNITLNSGRSITVQSQTIIDTAAFTGSQINGAVTFTGQMVKRGSTILNLNAAGSGAGGTRIDAGSISINNAASMGTGAITFNTTGTAILRTNALSGAVTLANNIVLTNPGSAGNLGILAKAGSGNSLQINGVISGGGANTTLWLDTDVGGDITGKLILNNTNTYSGKTYINRGSVQLNNAAGFGTSAVQFDSSANAVLSFNSAMTVVNNISYTFGAKRIDTGSNDVTLSGVQNLSAAISKEGSGKLTLTNANTGTATTTINGGTVALTGTGSLASNSIIVGANTTFDVSGVTGGYTLSSGKTISGNGTIVGALTVLGTLTPGNSTGDLSFSNNLGLGGTLTLDITATGSGSFDRLVGNGSNTLTLGGLLNLDSTGYTPVFGDQITVFSNWDSIGGTFSSITGTDLGGGFSWDTSNLATNGTLTVIPEPAAALLGGMGIVLLLRRRR